MATTTCDHGTLKHRGDQMHPLVKRKRLQTDEASSLFARLLGGQSEDALGVDCPVAPELKKKMVQIFGFQGRRPRVE